MPADFNLRRLNPLNLDKKILPLLAKINPVPKKVEKKLKKL